MVIGYDGGGDDDVWRLVLRQHPGLPAPTAEAYRSRILDLKLQGVTATSIAHELVASIGEAQRVLATGLEAFEQLIRTVELAGAGLEKPLTPDELMRHLVETKLVSARLMRELARLGPRAGAPTHKTMPEAEAYLADSEADVARFRETLAQRA